METVVEEGAIAQILGNLDPWSQNKKAWIDEIADELMTGLDFIMTGDFVLNARNSLWKLPLKIYLGSNK